MGISASPADDSEPCPRPGSEIGKVRDQLLVSQAQRGNRESLDALLRLHQPQVYAICRRLCGNDADAADASQEALIAIVAGIAGFDGRSTLSTWIYRITVNASLGELRRRRRRNEAILDVPLPAGTSPPHSPQVDDRMDIGHALQRLRPEFRAAVVLRDMCDLDYEEIGRILDVPIGTVRSRISRGRATLALLMRGTNEPPRSI